MWQMISCRRSARISLCVGVGFFMTGVFCPAMAAAPTEGVCGVVARDFRQARRGLFFHGPPDATLFLLGGRRRSCISAGRTELAVGQFLEALHLDRAIGHHA
jgi:hypothetical protein